MVETHDYASLPFFHQIERRATPFRFSLNFVIIIKSERGAWSPWRIPRPDIPLKYNNEFGTRSRNGPTRKKDKLKHEHLRWRDV